MFLRSWPPWIFLFAAVIPIVAVLGLAPLLPRPVALTIAGAWVIWAGAMTFLHWSRLDEAARAAHRWAWYWGGTIGLTAALIIGMVSLKAPVVTSIISQMGSFLVSDSTPPEQSYLFLGVMLCGVGQALGFAGAWLYWWAAKRGA